MIVWLAVAQAGSFVDDLVARGLYREAYVELLREAAACEEHAEELHFQAGQVLWDAGDWEAAGRHFGAMSGDSARLAEAWSWYQAGQEVRAAAVAGASARPEASYLAGLAHLQLGDPASASQAFAGTTGDWADRGQALSEQVARWQVPHKRPVLAGTLSAVLPGAGQAYVGRWGEAASAVLVNGLLIAAAAELYRRELWFGAGAVTFLELGFYGGGIASAANGARRANRVAWEERIEPLVRDQGLVLTAHEDGVDAETAGGSTSP